MFRNPQQRSLIAYVHEVREGVAHYKRGSFGCRLQVASGGEGREMYDGLMYDGLIDLTGPNRMIYQVALFLF